MHAKNVFMYTYGAVFCFTICLTLNGVLDLQQRPEVIAFGISSFFEMACLHCEEKGKRF